MVGQDVSAVVLQCNIRGGRGRFKRVALPERFGGQENKGWHIIDLFDSQYGVLPRDAGPTTRFWYGRA